jgi:alpha 1,2-mannosyltransferase
MRNPVRWFFVTFIGIVITVQLLYVVHQYKNSLTFTTKRRNVRYLNATEAFHEHTKASEYAPDPEGGSRERVRAVIIVLSRNSEIDGLRRSITQFERRFNSKFRYPYVFLNDQAHSEEFVREVGKLSKSEMRFGVIPREQWDYPEWINITQADAGRAKLKKLKVPYGDSLSYRHMCRFNSGFFFRHPLLEEYEYYWRVEPNVEFLCDVDYDPFLFMKKNNKKYGFTITIGEHVETIPTLWSTTQRFMSEHKAQVPKENSLRFLVQPHGEYNTCHFWSNFEIASLDFFRSKAYLQYFDYLDRAGGFFYERWGDAPVHTLAVAMLLPVEQIHHFEDIGYSHEGAYNCPINPALNMRCDCDPQGSINIVHECHRFWKLLELVRLDSLEFL